MKVFKPLLRLGNACVVERIIGVYKDAGVHNIYVVVGHQADQLEQYLNSTSITTVINPNYPDGMFSSIVAGIKALSSGCDAFFVHPVDIPLVRPSSIMQLMEAHRHHDDADIFYPTYYGKHGHPPLIRSELSPEIKKWAGEGGLRGFLNLKEPRAIDVDVADEGILLDMDTQGDYAALNQRFSWIDIPSEQECHLLMDKIHNVPEPIIAHCQAVAAVAKALGMAMNNAGCQLDLDLIRAAGLVHDIAREGKNHAAVGANILRELGFLKVADIVEVHMDIEVNPQETLAERHIVYLADKLVMGNRRADLLLRFDKKMKKYGQDPAAVAAINKRKTSAMLIKARIGKATGRSLETILAESLDGEISIVGIS